MRPDPLNAKTPGELFSNPANLKADYLELVRAHHPDRGGDAKVMAHINMLYQQAQATSTWVSDAGLRMKMKGSTLIFRHQQQQSFELGHIYYGHKDLVYVIDTKYSQLVANAEASMSKIKFPSAKFKEALHQRFPIKDYGPNTSEDDAKIVIGYLKEGDAMLLRHLMPNINRDPKHVAWILNRVYDLICSLHYGQLAHNNITLDSIFLSPKNHVAYLHGFWYAGGFNTPLTLLPKTIFSLAPPDVKVNKRHNQIIDLAAIKALGREILGDRTGMTLSKSPTVNFLRAPTSGSAVEDYQGWSNALTTEFGPKRVFHELVV